MTDSAALDCVGVGAALVDVLLPCTDDFLETVGGAKGGMEMVEAARLAELVAASGHEPQRAPGGAAANTTAGIAALGLRCGFIGRVGDDEPGAFYAQSLAHDGCENRLVVATGASTGQVLSLITPDAQRTMRTYLGAAAAQDPAHFTAEVFSGARLVMVEGYLLFNPDLARAVVAAARSSGAQIALDLASFEVVKAGKALLLEILDGGVAVVFANEDEAMAWHEDGIQAALDDLAQRAQVAVVKLGKDGAIIASGAERFPVAAVPAQAVDTTGAGDNFAAGFLAAWLRGLSLPLCGRVAALAGAAAVETSGARLPTTAWNRIRGFLDAQL